MRKDTLHQHIIWHFGNINYSEPILNEQLHNMEQKISFIEFDKYFSEKYEDDYVSKEEADIYSLPAPYNPIAYIPSAIGIWIAKILGGSIADIYITGRIFNLIAYLIMIAFAMKILPYKHNVFLTVTLMPMLLALASVYSMDGFTMGAVSIFIAYCLKLHQQEKITNKQLLILSMAFSLVICCKSMGYILISIIILILPIKNILKNNTKQVLLLIGLTLLILLINIGIMYMFQFDQISDPRVEGTNVKEQIHYIIENPKQYINMLYSNIKGVFSDFEKIAYINAPMFFGENFDNIFFYILLFIVYVGITDDSKNFNKREKIIFIITAILTIIMTTTALYLSYTPVGKENVVGYQMRYMFPVLPLIMICLSSDKIKNKNTQEELTYKVSYISLLFLSLCLLGVIM